MSPFILVGVHTVVGTVVVYLVLALWGEEQKIPDIALACLGAGLLMPIPTVGSSLSLLAMLGLLYWRCTMSVPALAASVALARLAMVPALMTFAKA
ncbi:MAG: hypothetical protein V4864_23250 [Pseudomonadota bacterium]